jgi:hypothetical protein
MCTRETLAAQRRAGKIIDRRPRAPRNGLRAVLKARSVIIATVCDMFG